MDKEDGVGTNPNDRSEGPSVFSFLLYTSLGRVLGAGMVVGLLLCALGVFSLIKGQQSSQPEIVDTTQKEVATATWHVEVAGAIAHPAVYALAPGSRIGDAIKAAGGFTLEADTDYVARIINQAARVTDGMKIYIPKKGESSDHGQALGANTSQKSTSSSLRRINVNTASKAELDSLPGVGEVTAEKIISGRPYQRVEELLEKKIVNSGVWEKIKDQISAY